MFKNKVSSKYTFTQMTLEEPDRKRWENKGSRNDGAKEL